MNKTLAPNVQELFWSNKGLHGREDTCEAKEAGKACVPAAG